MTPYQYLHGVTPDISAYLQYTLWQPVLFLDHEAVWPATNERSGRWLGVADNIGDALTFWVLDDQSKQVYARSVIKPLHHNIRVKWDPAFSSASTKTTAQNGGDLMPSKSLRQELLDSVMDKYDHFEPDPVENPATSQSPVTNKSPKTRMTKKSSSKPTYINPGLDITEAYVPLEPPKSSENSKLVLGSQPLHLDDTIPTYGRTGKKSYKEV